MQGPQAIPVFRPSYLTDGVEFQGSLQESPANVFYQTVKASRANLSAGQGRFQFQWRSVADSLLMSPTVLLRFQIDVTMPSYYSQALAYYGCEGVTGAKVAGTAIQAFADNVGSFQGADIYKDCAPLSICFADGDAFTSCCSSQNFTFNGTSLSLNRTNVFWRDFMKTQVASEDAARIYRASGGAWDHGDTRGCAVPLFGTGRGGAEPATGANVVAGAVLDSGIADRLKNTFNCFTNSAEVPGVSTRRLIVTYPVPIAPLNPWRGYPLPASSPYKNTPLAIPHLSAGGLDFLIEDFDAAFIRRLGRAKLSAGSAGIGALGFDAASDLAKVQMSLVSGTAEIELKYFRMAHTRALKESYRFNVWQAQTFLGPAASTAPTAVAGGIAAVGKDRAGVQSIAQQTVSFTDTGDKEWSIKFDTINLAQVPSYLLISVPKLNTEYSLASHSAGGNNTYRDNCIQNLSANLSIKSLKITVNSAQGHIDKSDDVTGYKDAERLWEMTKENSNSAYFREGGFRLWRDKQMAVLLSSAQFAPGLQVCDGVAYPINIEINMVVCNRHVDISAIDVAGGAQLGTAIDKQMHRIIPDRFLAQAQATAIFTKIVLATTETSATTNAMNYPLDSAERLLNAAGQMR